MQTHAIYTHTEKHTNIYTDHLLLLAHCQSEAVQEMSTRVKYEADSGSPLVSENITPQRDVKTEQPGQRSALMKLKENSKFSLLYGLFNNLDCVCVQGSEVERRGRINSGKTLSPDISQKRRMFTF